MEILKMTIIGGLLTSGLFTVIVLLSWYWTPRVWIADLTEGKEKPPVTPAGIIVLVSILLLMLLGPTFTLVWINQTIPLTFWEGFGLAAGVVFVINVVDVLVIDFAIYMWIRPSWMQIEGYEPLYSYWAHIKASLKGMVTTIPFYAASAGLMYLF